METLSYFIPIGKFIVASGLMSLFYLAFFRDKSTYRDARLYLLSIALISFGVANINITIYTPSPKVVERIEIRSLQPMPNEAQQLSELPAVNTSQPIIESSDITQGNSEVDKTTEEYLWENIDIQNAVRLIYLLVLTVLMGFLFFQVYYISRLRKGGKERMDHGIRVVENSVVPTPFSYGRVIFINNKLSASKREMVVEHERWHIYHHHYVDVFMMELIVRLFWFNPVMWWIRHELRNLHEFEADRSLLDQGFELYTYQTTILEEVMEHNPSLANGFNNSFIKKRFMKMKTGNVSCDPKLRRWMLIPLCLLLCMFCFSIGRQSVIYKDVIQNDLLSEESPIESSKALLPETFEIKTPENAYNVKRSVVNIKVGEEKKGCVSNINYELLPDGHAVMSVTIGNAVAVDTLSIEESDELAKQWSANSKEVMKNLTKMAIGATTSGAEVVNASSEVTNVAGQVTNVAGQIAQLAMQIASGSLTGIDTDYLENKMVELETQMEGMGMEMETAGREMEEMGAVMERNSSDHEIRKSKKSRRIERTRETEMNYKQLSAMMDNVFTSDERLKLIELAAKDKCFTSMQISSLMDRLYTSRERTEAAKLLFLNCVDKDNYHILLDKMFTSNERLLICSLVMMYAQQHPREQIVTYTMLNQMMDKLFTSNERISVLNQSSGCVSLRTSEISRLVDKLFTSNEKLIMLKAFYSTCLDKDNYTKLGEKLFTSNDRQSLYAYILNYDEKKGSSERSVSSQEAKKVRVFR